MNKLLFASLLVLASGCGSPPRAALFGPQRQLTADAYGDVLARWTRSDRVYKNFEAKMFVTATFHTPEIYGHGGNITRRELVDLTGDIEQFHNFFMAVYTPEERWNDLAQSDSIWRVNLIGSDEVAVDPAEVVTVKLDANLQAVYPYIGRFDTGYLVRFPLTDAMGRLVLHPRSTHATLRIASALGAAEMRWNLLPVADDRTDLPPTSELEPAGAMRIVMWAP